MRDKPVFRTPTDEEFNKALAFHTESAHGLLSEGKQRDYLANLTVHEWKVAENGEGAEHLTINLFPDFDVDHRRAILEEVGHQMGLEGHLVTMIFFSSEAWLSRGMDTPERGRARASEQPNREEIVMIAGQTGDGRKGVGIVHYTRNVRGIIRVGQSHVHAIGAAGLNSVERDLCSAFYQGLQAGLLARLMVRNGRNN